MIVNLPYSTIQCMFGVGGREGGGGGLHTPLCDCQLPHSIVDFRLVV